jgi:predicted ATPase
VDAFLDLAEAMAGRGPLALGLDDLQWADPSSLLTLGTLARRLPDGPVALLVSLRPLPRGGDLERTLEALEAAGARRLTLGQLDPEATRHRQAPGPTSG